MKIEKFFVKSKIEKLKTFKFEKNKTLFNQLYTVVDLFYLNYFKNLKILKIYRNLFQIPVLFHIISVTLNQMPAN